MMNDTLIDLDSSVFVNNKSYLSSRCDSVFGLVRFNMMCENGTDAFDFNAETDFIHTSADGIVTVLQKKDLRYITARCINENKFIIDIELKRRDLA